MRRAVVAKAISRMGSVSASTAVFAGRSTASGVAHACRPARRINDATSRRFRSSPREPLARGQRDTPATVKQFFILN
jgi:hypothetical protein